MKKLVYFLFILAVFPVVAQLARKPAARSSTRNANWPPTVTITSPEFGQTFQQGDNITFTATATGQSGVVTNLEWSIDGVLYETQTAPYLLVLTNALAGDHTAVASAMDNRGSLGQAIRFFSVAAPANIAPTVTLTSPSTGAKALVGQPITLSATAADIDGTISFVEFWAGTLLITNDATAPYTFAWIGPPGTNFSITAIAQDNQGSRATSSPPALISFTNYVPPQITITTPTQNQIFTNVASITFTASTVNGSGTVTGVTYRVGATTIGSAIASPWTVVWNSPPVGTWDIVATATDDGGVFTSSAFRHITVTVPANVAPTVTLTAPSTGTKALVGTAITITGTATDSDGTIALVEFRSGSTLLSTDVAFPYSYAWTGPPGTNFPLTLIAQDNQGARTTSSPPVLVSFTNSVPVVTNQPPTISITSPANNTGFVFPAAFTLNFAVADSDGTVASVRVFTNGVLSQTLTSAPWQVNYSALPVGSWAFSGRAFDNLGSNTLSSTVNVTIAAPPNVAPAVSITSPSNGASYTAPASFTIAVSATDSDGTIARVDLLLNNVVITNLTSAPYNFSITNLAAGTWSYRARAYDNFGTNTTSAAVVVTVVAPPPPPPDPPITFTAIGGDHQVTLNWSSVVGATSYALSRGTVPGTYFNLTNIVGLSFVDTAVTNGTTYYYRIASVNAQGTGTPSSGISVTPLGPPQATSIPRGSTWKFYDQDVNLGTIWRAVAFDDSAWLSGPAILGYPTSDGDIATLISYGRSTSLHNTTTYLRNTIYIADKTIYTNLLFNCIADDGVVVYLNGTEIYRFNVATGQDYHTLATVPITSPQERTWAGASVSTSLLVNGLNTVAVELHSKWNTPGPPIDTDDDLAFDGELINSTTTPPAIPDAPSALVATAVGQTRIDLRWSDNSDNETDFQIEESLNGTSFSVISSVGSNVMTYSRTGLSAGSTRYYRVRAHNTSGYSTYSGTACAITDSAPPQFLPAPTGLVATAGNATIALKWNPVSGAVRYVLQRAVASGGPYFDLASPSVTNYTDNAVTNGVTYYDRVASSNSVGIGPFSAFVSSTPSVGVTVPAAPSGLTATAGSAGTINLSWTDNSSDESNFFIESSNAIGGPYTEIGSTGAGVTTFSNSGLGSNVTRFYRVRSWNSAGYSASYSNIASATTITSNPGTGFYADPSGTAGGPGTQANPWTLAYALSGPVTLMNATDKTVYLNDGVFPGAYTCSIQAPNGSPVTFKGLNSVHGGSRAIIDRLDNALNASTVLKITGSARNIIFENIEIRNSAPRQDMNANGNLGSLYAGRSAGFQNDTGVGIELRGCIIHDTGNAISIQNNTSASGSRVIGNLVLYPGWDLPMSDAKGEGARGYAHGMYIQNDAGLVLLEDNIIGFPFSHGSQVTGSLDGGSRANNVTFMGDVHFMAGAVAAHNAGLTRNLLIGEEVRSTNVTVSETVTWYPASSGGSSLVLGYDSTAYDQNVSKNGIFQNNYVVGKAFAKQWDGIIYTGNTVVCDSFYVQGLRDVSYTTHGTWNQNEYRTVQSGSLQFTPFQRNLSPLSFGAWKAATGFDSNSVFTASHPTAPFIKFRVLSYDNRKANLTIVNWPNSDFVSVSMGGFLSNGDNYAMYGALSPFTVHQSGTYNGTSIAVDCRAASQAVMQPVGNYGVLFVNKTAPAFNCFRILKL